MASLYEVMHSIWRRRWLVLGITCFIATLITIGALKQRDAGAIAHSVLGERNDVLAVEATIARVARGGDVVSIALEEVSDNCYIGLDDNDVLSLFEGPPHDDKVIRSFFQINIKHLESSLPPEVVDQLYKGIQITNLSEYNSVLSTFSDYAVNIPEEVMQQIQ